MEDWQETALTNRHVHNRIGRTNRGKGKARAVFDIRRAFGTFQVECSATKKLTSSLGEDTNHARLEIYGLNPAENALYGELNLSKVLHAVVILAGSRKVMSAAIRDAEPEEILKELSDDTANQVEDPNQSANEIESEEETLIANEEDDDLAENRHAKMFEKNSFRSPKFWLRWQGKVLCGQTARTDGAKLETNTGYVVFSGKSCEKFQGTISCEQLEWDNVKIKGWKIASKPQRDFSIDWQRP